MKDLRFQMAHILCVNVVGKGWEMFLVHLFLKAALSEIPYIIRKFSPH